MVIIATAVLQNIAIAQNDSEPTSTDIEITDQYENRIRSLRNSREAVEDTSMRNLIIRNIQ